MSLRGDCRRRIRQHSGGLRRRSLWRLETENGNAHDTMAKGQKSPPHNNVSDGRRLFPAVNCKNAARGHAHVHSFFSVVFVAGFKTNRKPTQTPDKLQQQQQWQQLRQKVSTAKQAWAEKVYVHLMHGSGLQGNSTINPGYIK